LSGAIAKPASMNLWKLLLSPTGSIKPWFRTEGRLVAVLIIPFSWGSQLGGYHRYQAIFLAPLPGRKRISARGVSCLQSFILLLFCLFSLLYFCLHLFIKNTKN
jgi:hypothetical protein